MNCDSDIPVVLVTTITLLLFTVEIVLITIVDINFMVDIINLLVIVDIMVSVGCDSDIPTLSGAPASQATDRPPNGDHPREGERQIQIQKFRSRKHSALSDWFVQISWIYVCFLFMVSSFCFSF